MSRVTSVFSGTYKSLATVFGNPGLRRVNLAFAGSSIGDWAYATAMVVWAYGVGGVTAVGIWGTARLTMMTLASPFSATIVDRFPRKNVMIFADLTRAVLVGLGGLLIFWRVPALFVFVLATVAALVATPFRPAEAALLPALVDKPEELTAANGASSTIESLSFFVGPALGGILLTVASISTVVFLNALTFVWSALLVSRIKVDERRDANGGAEPRESKANESFANEVAAGFKAISSHRDLRLVALVYCAQTIVAGASIAFLVDVAVQMTPFGPKGVGYLDSALGVGAILGGLAAIARSNSQKLASDFGIGVILWALPLLIIAIWPAVWPAFVAVFVVGFANPIVDVNASTIIQRLAPDEVMGRVFGALQTGLMGSMALGSVAMPLLIALFGLRWSLASLALGITFIVLPSLGRLRKLDGTLRAPVGLAFLQALPLFTPLDAASLESIARQLVRLEVPAGTAVVREGEAGDRFYIVESGGTTATFQGKVLSAQGPGDPFGEIALLRDIPRTATVTATEDTVLLYLEREHFLAAVTGNTDVSARADDLVSRRIPTY